MTLCPNGSKSKQYAPSGYSIGIGDFLTVFGEDSAPYRLVLAIISLSVKGGFEDIVARDIDVDELCSEDPPQIEEVSIAEILNAFGVIIDLIAELEIALTFNVAGVIAGLAIDFITNAILRITLDKLINYILYTKWFEFCKCNIDEIPDPQPPNPPNPQLPPPCPECYQRKGKQYTIFQDGIPHRYDDPDNLYGDEYWDTAHSWKLLPMDIRVEQWLKRFQPDDGQRISGIFYDFAFGGYFLGQKALVSTGIFTTVRPLTNDEGRGDPGVYSLSTVYRTRIFETFTGRELDPKNPGDFRPPKCTRYKFTGACSDDNLNPKPKPLPPIPPLPEDIDVITVAIPTDCGIGEEKTYQINLTGTSKAVSVRAELANDCGITYEKNYTFKIKE